MKGYGLGRWLRLATMTALAKVEEKVAFPKFRLELHPLMLLTSNLSTSIILRSQRILCMTYKVNQLSKGILFISENKLGQQATLWNKWAETESKTHCGLVKIATFQISYCRGIPICVLKRKLVSSLTGIVATKRLLIFFAYYYSARCWQTEAEARLLEFDSTAAFFEIKNSRALPKCCPSWEKL